MRLAETRTAEGGGRQQGGTNEPISMDGHGGNRLGHKMEEENQQFVATSLFHHLNRPPNGMLCPSPAKWAFPLDRPSSFITCLMGSSLLRFIRIKEIKILSKI
jgi:hypothetical protein